MSFEPQTIVAPDGSRLVVIPETEYRALRDAAEDVRDIAAADRALRDSGGFTVPAAVLDAQLAGKHPVAAWRDYRDMTQGALASATGLTQPAIARLEKGRASPRDATLAKLATALDVPAWALELDD